MRAPGRLGLLLAACLLAPGARAQTAPAGDLQTRFGLSLSNTLGLPAAGGPTVLWTLTAHLEAWSTFRDLSLHVVLDPALTPGPGLGAEAGLTEASVLRRAGEFDLSAGVERLPLEVARLSLPYVLEPVDTLGRRGGVPGARLSWNPEGARLRLAVLLPGGHPVPVLSARREFGAFEVEAHGLLRDGGGALGLGGSGTVGGVVLYGEVWALTAPPGERLALGASGTRGRATWTVEGGYASPTPGTPPRRLALAQVALPQGEDAGWTFSGGAFLDPDALRGVTGLTYTRARGDSDGTLTLTARWGPPGPAWALGLQVRRFLR